jgi:CDP-paratose 2-epimerase
MRSRPVLICGGAGFIGTNLADRLMAADQAVLLFDNLSRDGVASNVDWLRERHGRLLTFVRGDIRDSKALSRCVEAASAVFHFAGQTAVTTSIVDPFEDFEINVAGTIRLLEHLRQLPVPIPLLFTSTNKVYGNLEDLELRCNGSRYEPQDPEILRYGVSEDRTLSFHSPYGCSKGAAEQYVLDYARTYGLPNAVFRMSCIYGPHQFGTEDQGWVAHFLIQALQGNRITLYGDGLQVRDVLFVEDLISAFLSARESIDTIAGCAFNIGGGPSNTVSLVELLRLIGAIEGQQPEVCFRDWRVGDQRYYVSDARRFQTATGWAPKVGVRSGVQRLYEWLNQTRASEASAALHGGAW